MVCDSVVEAEFNVINCLGNTVMLPVTVSVAHVLPIAIPVVVMV